MLKNGKEYKREENIVYEIETNKPVLKLKQWFPNIKILSNQTISYLNNYCTMFPNLCEIIQEQNSDQLSLF